ncbi:serine hydrolase [Streptomyces sp. NPDC005279]|uniref:serine hydrolase n=1 Tax=Streptomyces sp. NPDC005279 TaxID=3364712 RepID=UPI003685A527
MTHGGTVAGESPDKSEQRKSSGETTSGERDPRLTVFRQASPGAAASGVDQPTAIFRTPAEPSAPASAEPGTESGSVENDARLRAAVAAWVASADDEGAPAATEAPSEAAEAEVPARGPGNASEGLSGDQAGSGISAERESAAAGEAGSPEEDEADVSESSGQDDERASGDEAGPGASAETEPAVAEGLASEADGGAAEPESRDGDTSEARDGDTSEARDGDTSEARDGETSEFAEPGSAPEFEPAHEAAASAPSGRDDEANSGDEPRSDATAELDAADAEGPGSEAAKPAAVPAPVGEAEAPAGQDADEDGSSGSAAASAESTPSGTGTGTGTRTDDAARTAPAKGQESADAKGAATAEEAAPKRAVDQPTAVFKAPRRPRVDQPTTALKVPPAPRSKPDPEAEPKPEPSKPGPKADVPRSSTFVPLRADDVRSPAEAKSQAAAPPAVTPAAATPSAPASLTEAERTKQQPMPPLPPLDLLAELTNTPPPTQTPVRTVFRRIKIWTPLVLLLLVVFAIVQAVRPLPDPSLALSAEPTFTFKGGPLSLPWPDEGQGAVEVEGVGSIGTYGAQQPAPIASVAKTMTAYVILRDHPISGKEVGQKITVDQQAEDESKNDDESTAQISMGQQFTEKQMLQLLMIPSGNNAARLLARWDSKTEAEFVKKMNDAAKDLGMANSTYTDPSGLKATTVSTPQDQLKLAKAVMQNDVFRDIVNTTMTTIPGIDGNIRNNNDKALLLDGVGGIKTGSSTPAGGNLLWSANVEVDGKVRRIVGITMGAQKATILNDKLDLAIDYSIKVIQAAQAGVTSATVVKKGDVVGYVDNGLGGRTAVIATKDLKAVGWGGLKVEIALSDSGKTLPHSAKAGAVVGQVSVGSGTGKVTAPVALQQDLVEPGLGDKLTRLG